MRVSPQKLLIAILLLMAGASFSEEIPNFALLDTDGFQHELHRLPESQAVVFVRLDASPGEAPLQSLALRNGPLGIQSFGIVHTRDEASLPALEELPASPRPAPVLVDRVGEVTQELGLAVVGDAVLVARDSWQVLGRAAGGAAYEAAVQGMVDAFRSGTLKTPAEPDAARIRPAALYEKHIVPILQQRCMACHAKGGAAPITFSSYEKVKGWAPMLREVILTKRMPPWFADPHFGEFENERGLQPEEERTLLAWLDAECPKEAGSDPLKEQTAIPATEWILGPPDLVLSLPEEQQIPAEGLLDYRHIEIPLKLETDVWVQGVHVRPSNPKLVHHVLMFLKEPGKSVDLRGEFFASFLPGSDPDLFPPGTGKLLPKDATVLLQLHYTPSGKEEVDQTEVGLYLCKEPPGRVLRTASAYSRDFVLPPGASAFPVKASYTFSRDATLFALRPHMHYRGRRISYEVLYPDGNMEILLSVPAYNFYWQTTYVLKEPKRIPAGTIIICQGLFDNSARNPLNPDPEATVIWGDHSIDEMLVGDLRFAYREEEDGG